MGSGGGEDMKLGKDMQRQGYGKSWSVGDGCYQNALWVLRLFVIEYILVKLHSLSQLLPDALHILPTQFYVHLMFT